MNKINTRKALNPAYRKHKPLRKDVANFIVQLQDCINAVKLSDENSKYGESEEHIKSHFTTFFNSTFYADNYINTKDKIDLAIYTENNAKSDVAVIIEAKKPSNKAEFLRKDNLNKKALQELLLYYLRERLENNNNNIKHLIATNGYEWYLFKGEDFYKYFFKNKPLIKEYEDFRDGLKDTSKNELFYDEIAKKYIAQVEKELPFVYLDFTQTNLSELKDEHLNTLYKIFSDVHILGHPFGNDSNQLNKTFYNELLHIIGLEEVKDKGKKVINRKGENNRDYASLLENAIVILEDRDYLSNIKSIPNGEEKSFDAGLELCLTWVNRILFLKLLESQLLAYHKKDEKYKFLNADFINGFDDLNDLFFSALAKPISERHPKYKDKYKDIPYLNSSLFERNTLENEAFEISALNNDDITIYSGTILKDANGKKQKGKLATLEYLFQFLDAYDFATDGSEGIEDNLETKSLINASVLGLIFEKINGYKEGSFYTPAYITMYMCRETIRRTVIQKFKEQENDQIESFEDLQSYCSRLFKVDDLKRLNAVVDSVKICDPAVGSGHFLVSALNELIVIKNELRILIDAKGVPLRCDIEIVNDELYVIDDNGLLFEYNPKDKESARIQHTLFHEKQTLIENCLFGVDINPNSVKICRLRLWIELLKNAYYTQENRLQTLPNIDINIKCGNSLISRFNLEDDLKGAFKNKEVNYSFLDYKNAVLEYKETNSKERKRAVLEIINEVKNNFKSTLDNAFLSKYQKVQGDLINEQERQSNLKNFGEKIKKAEKDALKKLKSKAEKAFLEKEEIVNNAIYHNAFEWRFEFPEVLSEDGTYIGFDAIIGNPPYFQIQYSEYSSMNYFSKYKVFERTGDIYSIFFEKGIEILSEFGHLSYITSNRFCSTNYGKSTRNYLSKFELTSLININNVDIFDEANVGTLISILCKNDRNLSKNTINVIDVKELKQAFSIQNISNGLSIKISQRFFDSRQWIFTSNKILELKEKIESKGKPLKSVKDLKINRGITTGANGIFIIDKNIGDAMININSKNSEILKPVLKGAEIKRYFTKDYSNYIILSKTNIDIEEYPEVYTYLEKHRAKLENVYEARKGSKKWYELRNCSYYDSFVQEKLIWTKLASINSFAISSKSEYSIDSTSFAIGSNLRYYSAILNSKLIFFYFKLGSVVWGKDGIKWFGDYFDSLPIIVSSDGDILKVESIVNKVLSIREDNPKADTSILEEEIDQMVYKLYGLTSDEIKIVENS
ncbi:BREX-1 system adenine-specific DNA-methyltransferase PglX [Polaribacter sp.]|nr:BREX-1 system adenine-specific DNA-methyltransferase PglX [Polaribacter sp.]